MRYAYWLSFYRSSLADSLVEELEGCFLGVGGDVGMVDWVVVVDGLHLLGEGGRFVLEGFLPGSLATIGFGIGRVVLVEVGEDVVDVLHVHRVMVIEVFELTAAGFEFLEFLASEFLRFGVKFLDAIFAGGDELFNLYSRFLVFALWYLRSILYL